MSLEGSPVYALSAVGPYAAEIHVALIGLLGRQAALDERARLQRVCLAGRLTDRCVELLSGQVVAVVEIDGPRGLHGLNVAALADAAIAHLPALSGVARQALRAALSDFLTRVHVELANVGVTPAQRALNFAATNAYQAADSFAAALARGMVLD
ncbi:MAG: peptidase S8, partial [Actinobacteria bacterium]|nr:peptidase S8 [Actinomycetota bacterium]